MPITMERGEYNRRFGPTVGDRLRLADTNLFALALRDDSFEKAPNHIEAIAVADTRQAGVVSQGLVKVVAEVPAHAQAIRGMRRSERIPSKNMTNWSLKNTTGSMDGRPPTA